MITTSSSSFSGGTATLSSTESGNVTSHVNRGGAAAALDRRDDLTPPSAPSSSQRTTLVMVPRYQERPSPSTLSLSSWSSAMKSTLMLSPTAGAPPPRLSRAARSALLGGEHGTESGPSSSSKVLAMPGAVFKPRRCSFIPHCGCPFYHAFLRHRRHAEGQLPLPPKSRPGITGGPVKYLYRAFLQLLLQISSKCPPQGCWAGVLGVI